jgi:hypothetical protein
MNFDPYDSVAWRTFGMLDAEETALFDEAMRDEPGLRRACLEMDRLAAAIAATTVEPVCPPAGQLERLQRRLGLAHAGRKSPLWLTVSGWSVAAALAGVLAWDRFGSPEAPPSAAAPAIAQPVAAEVSVGPGAKLETQRLTQEIEVLRRSLEQFHQRDREMFQVLPGKALPLVMNLVPPGETVVASADPRSPLTAMLGDALAATNRHAAAEEPAAETEPASESEDVDYAAGEAAAVPEPQGPPTAVPIYDAARDAGTLVVSNLPPAGEGQVYNLWVITEVGARPVYIGSLPESSAAGGDSFDFSLGSSMVLPAGFVLTLDPANSPANPTEGNTILQGPPTPAR